MAGEAVVFARCLRAIDGSIVVSVVTVQADSCMDFPVMRSGLMGVVATCAVESGDSSVSESDVCLLFEAGTLNQTDRGETRQGIVAG